VRTEAPRRPREVVPEAPAALEAVCLKALSKKPAERYATAGELALEVQHYLADEPVAAYREPLPGRLLRWGRRHRPLVAGAAALLLAAVVALGVGLILLEQAGARTEQQRQLAEANFVEAQRQRDLARANFEMARRAVDDYFVQVSENTLLKSPQPGLQPLRKQLLESALKYYQEFVRQSGDDPELQGQLADAYYRVGRITAEIGSREDALRAFHRSRDLYEALVKAYPKKTTFRVELVKTYRAVGRVEHWLGRRPEASASFQQAVGLAKEVVDINPDDPESRHSLAMSYNNLGTSQYMNGQPAAGRHSLEQAIATWERLIDKHPRAEFRSGLALACSNLGWNLTLAGLLPDALAATQRAVALDQAVVQESGANPELRSRLSGSLDNLGNVYFFVGQPAKAREAYQAALDVGERVARENPAVREYQEKRILFLIDLGYALLGNGQDAEAQRTFAAALELDKKRPEGPSMHVSRASIHRGLGKVLRKQGKTAAALEALQKAVQIGETNPGGQKPFTTYELACARALCSAVLGEGKAKLTAEEQEAKSRYADQAMEALGQAVAEGWGNVPWMKIDRDLDALRDRPDFRKLLVDLEEKQAR
jgi:serine/threonine-protein kinase